MKPFKKGDEVICLVHGEGIIQDMNPFNFQVFFHSAFQLKDNIETYTYQGQLYDKGRQVLFHKEDAPILLFPKYKAGQVLELNDSEVRINSVDTEIIYRGQITGAKYNKKMLFTGNWTEDQLERYERDAKKELDKELCHG